MELRRNTLSTYSPMGQTCTDYEPFHAITPSPDVNVLHCHDFYEFYIYFSGAEYYTHDENVYPLKPYSLFITPPFTLHGLMGTRKALEYERAWLYVSPGMMRTLGFGHVDLQRYFRECADEGKLHFEISQATAEKLKEIILSIRSGMSDQSPIGKWRNLSLINDFLCIICEISEHSSPARTTVVVNETMHQVLSYVNEHFTEALALPELARRFGVSVSYLSHQFVIYTGRSVYDYVLYQRILLAKEMICSGKQMTEVAYLCGFNDYTGFLRAFVKGTGQTPSAYRKKIQSQFSK